MNKLGVSATMLVLLAGSLAACNLGGGAANAANGTGNAVNSTSNGSAAPGINASAGQPAGAGQSAQTEAEVRDFLDQIYAGYQREGGEGADYEKVLDPQLAAAIKATEGGAEADPFIDAQDWTPFKPTYEKIEVRGNRAIATASFVNINTPTRIDYQLMRTPNGWRVYDVQNAAGASLRERFLNRSR